MTRGKLVQDATGQWVWRPRTEYDSELLSWHEDEESWRFEGDLEDAIYLVKMTRILEVVKFSEDDFSVQILDRESEELMAWGSGDSMEESMRYALGALWGDTGSKDHNDENLRVLLSATHSIRISESETADSMTTEDAETMKEEAHA